VIERKVYQCEHCKVFRKQPRIYFSKQDTYLHECRCWYNLKNKTCFTCKHNNEHYNESVDKRIGCELGLLKQEGWTLSDLIKKNCGNWEYKFDSIEESGECEE
jgi:hypothetical protein